MEEVPPDESDHEKSPRRAPDGFLGTRDVLGRLHLRVGRVIHVEEHVTDPDLYFFEYIDAGDRFSQALIRGLNKHYAPDDFTAKRVVLLYMALPFWWNNQESRLISVLSAHSKDGSRVELLIPPPCTKPGDLVRVKGHINSGPPPAKPTYPFYAPLGELLFLVAPYFSINSDKVATFKGVPLEVSGKGFITTETLTNCPVR